MSNGTHNDKRHMYQAVQNQRACVEALQLAPAGLSLAVPAHRGRSCSTRRTTRLWHPASLYLLHPCSRMNLTRSIALHAAQKPSFPATHEQSGLKNTEMRKAIVLLESLTKLVGALYLTLRDPKYL